VHVGIAPVERQIAAGNVYRRDDKFSIGLGKLGTVTVPVPRFLLEDFENSEPADFFLDQDGIDFDPLVVKAAADDGKKKKTKMKKNKDNKENDDGKEKRKNRRLFGKLRP